MLIGQSFSSVHRPVLVGQSGAVAAAHPLAVAAGQTMLQAGGSAVDAVIAAQAVLCVLTPDACGLGGDGLCLVRAPDGRITAINGTGALPLGARAAGTDGGSSVTVPGLVDAWVVMHQHWGRLAMARLLGPAIRLARDGIVLSQGLAEEIGMHRPRLARGGAESWPLMQATAGCLTKQETLGSLLQRIGESGRTAFYEGPIARGLCEAVQRTGGWMDVTDLAAHETVVAAPVTTQWRGQTVHVQPPVSQGVLLSMALAAQEQLGPLHGAQIDHAGVELTESCFAFRDRVGEGAALLSEHLPADLERASRRGGPRAYLHTAGVAASDRSGLTVSSLVSVFDSFGAAVYVPEGGFTLNNRGAGFTQPPNNWRGGIRPVHTLAPVLVESEHGCLALATPGADGQVQTLLQIHTSVFVENIDLATAIARPRWRSQNSRLLVETTHRHLQALTTYGHDVAPTPDGDLRFGGVVCAGLQDGRPFCCSDWRRDTWSGVV